MKFIKSEVFKKDMRLRYGGWRSPTLFNVDMDNVIRKTEQKTIKLGTGHRLQMIQC